MFPDKVGPKVVKTSYGLFNVPQERKDRKPGTNQEKSAEKAPVVSKA
jgi:hypothetical protein